MAQPHQRAVQGKASGKAVQLGSVKKIARYGTAQRGEMYADLMGTAGVQPESEQTAPSEGFQHAVIGTCGLSIRAHFATDGRAVRLADRQVDHALRLGRRALDYGEGFLAKLRDSRDNRGDTRVKYNLGEGDYGADGGRLTFCRKFLGDMSAGKMVLDADLIYYRAALAVMMDAELKYYRKDYGGALESLNIIAKRAYGKDDYYTDASQEAVLEALVDEYFLEFPAEGVIWWALIRLDKIWDYNDYLAANRNNTNILLWPISKSARDKNSNLTQTEGWY